MSNVTPPGGAGELSVTVKVNVVPPLVSPCVTSSIVRSGVVSSSRIVPRPCVSPGVAPVMLLTLTKNVSSVSGSLSPFTVTLNWYGPLEPIGMVRPVRDSAT